MVQLDDGTLAAVVAAVPCTVRLPAGGDGPGVALWWQQRGGTASGVMVRADADTLWRVAADRQSEDDPR